MGKKEIKASIDSTASKRFLRQTPGEKKPGTQKTPIHAESGKKNQKRGKTAKDPFTGNWRREGSLKRPAEKPKSSKKSRETN